MCQRPPWISSQVGMHRTSGESLACWPQLPCWRTVAEYLTIRQEVDIRELKAVGCSHGLSLTRAMDEDPNEVKAMILATAWNNAWSAAPPSAQQMCTHVFTICRKCWGPSWVTQLSAGLNLSWMRTLKAFRKRLLWRSVRLKSFSLILSLVSSTRLKDVSIHCVTKSERSSRNWLKIFKGSVSWRRTIWLTLSIAGIGMRNLQHWTLWRKRLAKP